MRKTKEITNEEWNDILVYAKTYGITAASKQFKVYADPIKYRLDPTTRQTVNEKMSAKYAEIKLDKEAWNKRQEANKQYHESHKQQQSDYLKEYQQRTKEARKAYCKQYQARKKAEKQSIK